MQEVNSTKPYLLRALHEWCTDNGYTPQIVVRVDQRTRVPRQFVSNDEVVLNIGYDATGQLQMGNEWIEFNARFSGKAHKIEVQVANVLAIYARENGQGMAFPLEPGAAPSAPALVEEPAGRTLTVVESPSTTTSDADADHSATPAPQREVDPSGEDGSKSGGKGKKGHLKIVK